MITISERAKAADDHKRRARRATRSGVSVLLALVVALLSTGMASAGVSTTTYGPYQPVGETGGVTVKMDCRVFHDAQRPGALGAITTIPTVGTIPGNHFWNGLTKVIVVQNLQRWNGSRWVHVIKVRGADVGWAWRNDPSNHFNAVWAHPTRRGYYRIATAVAWQNAWTRQFLGGGNYYTPYCYYAG